MSALAPAVPLAPVAPARRRDRVVAPAPAETPAPSWRSIREEIAALREAVAPPEPTRPPPRPTN